MRHALPGMLALVLLRGCSSEPAKPPAVGPSAPIPAPASPAPADSDDDAPGTCGTRVCTSDELCEDLYKGHALDARGRPIDRKKCVPIPASCKAEPTCACITKQVASTHCKDDGGPVYLDDYPARR